MQNYFRKSDYESLLIRSLNFKITFLEFSTLEHNTGLIYPNMKYLLLSIIPFALTVSAFANGENRASNAANDTDSVSVHKVEDLGTIYPDDPIAAMLDSMYYHYFYANQPKDERVALEDFLALDHELDIPVFSDSIIAARVEELNLQTPFELRYNPMVLSYINMYTGKRRKLSSKILGLSDVYFPLFEQMLDKYDMPLELKYLAVIESALNPKARSRMGATGLWQFMYRTGKMYNLDVTSFVDERMDPYLATEAACRYLKFLHGMYDDWNLALAAYNAGPGNVNKALRRAGGGKKGYWEVRRFLPRETQGYVPAFIAVNYMMNYAGEHMIYADETPVNFFDYDTVMVREAVSFEQISEVVCVDKETLQFLNPVYKRGFIPPSDKGRVLYLPKEHVGVFLMNEDYVYNYKQEDFDEEAQQAKIEEEMTVHYVRSGEYLGLIASRYGCSVSKIMEWNNMRSSRLRVGQKLVIYPSTKTAQKKPAPQKQEEKKEEQKQVPAPDGKYRYHTVQQGDSLWEIAKKYEGITVKDLENLNQGLNFKRLKPGQKIKIGVDG